MIHSSMKVASTTDAFHAIKKAVNGVLINHMHKADLRPSEFAQILQTDVHAVRDLVSYKLDNYSVEHMLVFVMNLGYEAETACNQHGQLTFTFSKKKS